MEEKKADKKPESSPRNQSMGERLTERWLKQEDKEDKEPSGLLQTALAFVHRKHYSDPRGSRVIAEGALILGAPKLRVPAL